MKRYLLFRMILLGLLILLMSSCEKQDDSFYLNKKKEINSPTDRALIKSESSNSNPINAILITNQNVNVGTINISQNSDELFITYNTSSPFLLKEIYLWIGEDISDLPQTSSGYPLLFLFPFIARNLDGISTYELTISLSYLGEKSSICFKDFYIAARATLIRTDSSSSEFQTDKYSNKCYDESAWAYGNVIINPISYIPFFSYKIDCNPKEVR